MLVSRRIQAMATIGRPRTAQYRMCFCEVCNTEFEVASWSKNSGKFCSSACWHTAKRGRPIEKLRKSPLEKKCPICGILFLAGGWHNAKRTVIYCSRACSSKAHRIYAEPHMLSVVDASYLAGIVDGEGSIIQVKPRAWRVAIYQSDEPFILWVREVTGTGLAAKRPATACAGKNLVKQGVFKVGWHWQLYGHNAALFIRQLLPYLRIKRALAEAMLRDYVDDAAQHDS